MSTWVSSVSGYVGECVGQYVGECVCMEHLLALIWWVCWVYDVRSVSGHDWMIG